MIRGPSGRLCFPLTGVLLFVASASPLRAAGENLLDLEQQSIQQAVARVAPSVVRVDTVGGLERVGDVILGDGPTTGLVVSADGYIVSSAFNFARQPSSILVHLPGGTRTAAKLVAKDHSRQLVLLKVQTEAALAVPEAAPVGQLAAGQWATAVGRTFDPERPNVSVGIVSALGRIWSKAVQTDAKISPSNYGGPLVDIRGRVIGVLVPMSTEEAGEMDGVDWYDSGIGFAVPLEHILSVLPRWQKGEDLRAGLMGISLRGSDLYSEPPVIAATHPGSPAAKAELKVGDIIVEAAGQPVTRQAELKHQVTSRYAGDKLRLVITREGKRLERELELAAELPPYERPWLGILPARRGEGVTVRYVFQGSPAAQAGLMAGDRLTKANGVELKAAAELRSRIATLAPGESVKLEVLHGSETKSMELKLSTWPDDIPAELPPDQAPAGMAQATVGAIRLKLPEFEKDSLLYVPEHYHQDHAHGVLIWLQPPGETSQDELLERWKEHCRQRQLILLAPTAMDAARWQRSEVEFIRKSLEDVLTKYQVDRSRIFVHGHQGGAAMAWLVALTQREAIRGVAAVESQLPAGLEIPANDPTLPLAVYVAYGEKSAAAAAIETNLNELRSKKYAPASRRLPGEPRYLSPEELEELARWIDSLDRI